MAYIVVDENKCKSCYLCIDACPKKIIKKNNKIGTTGDFLVEFLDPNSECLGCKSCALVCPDLAIKEVYK